MGQHHTKHTQVHVIYIKSTTVLSQNKMMAAQLFEKLWFRLALIPQERWRFRKFRSLQPHHYQLAISSSSHHSISCSLTSTASQQVIFTADHLLFFSVSYSPHQCPTLSPQLFPHCLFELYFETVMAGGAQLLIFLSMLSSISHPSFTPKLQ